jgi:uncharacterized protein YciI
MENMPPSKTRVKDIPRNLKPYFLAIFRAGEHWNHTEGAEDLPAQQLAFLRAQCEAGVYRAAGPITDGGETTAIAIIEADNLAAATQIAEQDPAVRAARLTVTVHPTLLPALDSVRTEY